MHRFNFTLLLCSTFVLTLHFSSAQLKYDDDVTTRKLHLEDIENEEEQRLLQQTQQLPLSPSSAGTKYFAPALRKSPSAAAQFRYPLYDVEALTSRLPPAIYRDFQVAAAQRFRLHDSDYNDISAQQQNDDDYYNEYEPLLQQQYRNGAPNDDYALKQTLVLVPPFGSSDARKQAAYQQEPPQQQQYAIDPYVPNEPSTSALATLHLPAGGVQYLASNKLRERELPNSSSSSSNYDRRPALEYGVPDASARRPKQQSNQRAYAPQRSESGTLAHHTIPYPPSFISITTSRPQYSAALPSDYIASPPLPFESHTHPLPVPDYFAQRSAKSLLDSYIPSWVVHEMLQQYRQHVKRNQLNSPSKRYFKRESSLLTQKNKSKAAQSLTKQHASSAKDEELLMTA